MTIPEFLLFLSGLFFGILIHRILYRRRLARIGDVARNELIGDHWYTIIREDVQWKLRHRLTAAEEAIKKYQRNERIHREFLDRFNNS